MKVLIYYVALFVICFASYASCAIEQVTIAEDDGGDKPPNSVVAEQCGGPGLFFELYWQGCENTDGDLCKISASENSELSVLIGYVPAADLESLGARVTVTIEGSRPVVEFDGPIPDSAVEKGKPYIITVVMVDVMIPEEWKGKTIEAQYEILEGNSGDVRVCVKDKVIVGE